jgi:hypothetical protein
MRKQGWSTKFPDTEEVTGSIRHDFSGDDPVLDRQNVTYRVVWRPVGRLSPALPGPALLLLATLGCEIMISGFSHDDQHEAMVKETPMKVTTKARLQAIGKITMLGILRTVADVAAALIAATSG